MGDSKHAGIVAAASKFSSDSLLWTPDMFSKTEMCVCVSENHLQVVKGLEDVEVSECESCSFEVTLSVAYIAGLWTRDGTQLKSKPSCCISTHGKKHSLILKRVTLGDAGLYCFQANSLQTLGRLSVRGKIYRNLV